MTKKYILITGITGFLGSHIAENLINNFNIIGLKREKSNIWRCLEFKDKVTWIDIDEEKDYIKKLTGYSIDTIIHGAWIGIESFERDDWSLQIKNIQFLSELLQVAKEKAVKKFIFLGSQAEYGNINGIVSEEQVCEAFNAYGSVKLACLEILKTFSINNKINWIWLRLFSFFGEKENETWLFPSLIKKIKTESEMDFTLGEQKYAYLYVKDFALIMDKLVTINIKSGIYNVSSNSVRSIRSLVEEIQRQIKPSFQLNFGALKYRDNQSMHIQGSINKLNDQIGKVEFTDFTIAIENTINYYNK
jgi:nucleoside-diphosphate-sugar epimerase